MFFSCGNNDYADPNIVAQKFLANYVTMNYSEAQKYASQDFFPTLEIYEADKALMDKSVIDETKTAVAEIKSINVQEAEGTATVTFTNSQLPDLVDQLDLKKVEDKWLVSNLERKTDILTDEKFSDDFIDELEQDAAQQDEIIPTE
jgi:beta-lactam-binding protein with PASTA domain